MDHEKVREYLNTRDRFCAVNRIQLTKIWDGGAEAELEITSDSLNGLGAVQGGAIMTLADFAFAGAANSEGKPMVALNSSVNFIRPGSGARLRAVARAVNRGRRTGVYSIEVFNDDGKLVAAVTTTGFAVETPFPVSE